MTTILELPCGGETHRIEILEDGRAVMLEHNEKTVRSFMAFEAEVPPCFVVQQRIKAVEDAYRAAIEMWVADATTKPEHEEAMRRVRDEMQQARRMTLRGRFVDASKTGLRHRRLVHQEGVPTSIRWRHYIDKLLILQDVAIAFEVRVVK